MVTHQLQSSAGQRKHAGQRPMLYRWTMQPTRSRLCSSSISSFVLLMSEEVLRKLSVKSYEIFETSRTRNNLLDYRDVQQSTHGWSSTAGIPTCVGGFQHTPASPVEPILPWWHSPWLIQILLKRETAVIYLLVLLAMLYVLLVNLHSHSITVILSLSIVQYCLIFCLILCRCLTCIY